MFLLLGAKPLQTLCIRLLSCSRVLLVPLLVLITVAAFGQDAPTGESEPDFIEKNIGSIVIGILMIILLILIFVMFMMGDKLVNVSAERAGKEDRYSLLPKLTEV